MDTLLKFGDGGLAGREYVFNPDDQISLSNNFSDVVPQTARILGASGGFNQYGRSAPPTSIGTISYTYWLYFDNTADAIVKRDALMAASGWGLQRLYVKPQNGDDVRYTRALVNNSTANFNAADLNHRRMRVTITFHVPDPHWYRLPVDAPVLDTGMVLDDGHTLPTWPTSYDVSSATTQNITISGSARALPHIWVEPGATGEVENLRIVRRDLDTMAATHDITWSGTVGNDERLRIYCDSQKVVYEKADTGNIDGWYALDRQSEQFLELEPGVNRLEIGGTFTNTVKITFAYREAYR